jgi:hypothetical protein
MIDSWDGCPKVTSESKRQSENAACSIAATDLGIRTDPKPDWRHSPWGIAQSGVSALRPRQHKLAHSQNAKRPTSSKEPPSTHAPTKCLHPKKHATPIRRTEFGTEIHLSPQHWQNARASNLQRPGCDSRANATRSGHGTILWGLSPETNPICGENLSHTSRNNKRSPQGISA